MEYFLYKTKEEINEFLDAHNFKNIDDNFRRLLKEGDTLDLQVFCTKRFWSFYYDIDSEESVLDDDIVDMLFRHSGRSELNWTFTGESDEDVKTKLETKYPFLSEKEYKTFPCFLLILEKM